MIALVSSFRNSDRFVAISKDAALANMLFSTERDVQNDVKISHDIDVTSYNVFAELETFLCNSNKNYIRVLMKFACENVDCADRALLVLPECLLNLLLSNYLL